jgi:hypothetical protein
VSSRYSLALLAALVCTLWHASVSGAELVELKDVSVAEPISGEQRDRTPQAVRTFYGHFTGYFGSTQGHGAPVAFIATDLLEIDGGRILNNWQIEDNLTLFKQMGLSP